MIRTLTDLRKGIEEQGFCVLDADQFEVDAQTASELTAFQCLWNSLVPDQYVEIKPCPRLRRYAQFRYEPANEKLYQLPHGPYYQSLVSNPLYGGRPRNFAPFEKEAIDNVFLRELMTFNVAHLPGLRRPLHIHTHMVRIIGLKSLAGEPSPEGLHQDGFDLISIHLISRSNAHGGETSVLNSDGEVLVRTALAKPMDSIYLNDRLLYHSTSPILPSKSEEAIRDVLLFSYQEEQ